ncbi:CDP-alcohol phosphatidyltransferase family protein [Candidatus Pacearchaeota archaeon]|nr:CDP-alcohol phosphatidyltransferase family protein [Candidatus Pacearchaeota archaeon]
MKKSQKSKRENIWNIPNTLTFIRVVITFAIIYLIFARFSLVTVAIFFIIGMLTDFLDGQIARRTKTVTEFGRQFDMIADRFLMTMTAIALIIDFSIQGVLTRSHMFQVFLILSREIVSFPFAIVAFVWRKPVPDARFIGKLTTFMQGVTLPAILLSTKNEVFSFSLYLAIATCIIGIFSALTYVKDLQNEGLS